MTKIFASAKALKEIIDKTLEKNPDAMVVISVDKLRDIDDLLMAGAKLIWFTIDASISESNNIELMTDEILQVFE